MGLKEQQYKGVPVYDPEHNEDERFIFKKQTMLDGTEMDVMYRKGNPGYTMEELIAARERGEMTFSNFCPKLDPRSFEVTPGIICDRDVCCVLRDGTRIYADIYRPANTTEKVPVIVSWSPFGKRQSEGMGTWKLMGVPPHTVSQWAKFESPDPGYWCHQGYAIANVDPRGVGNSEGDSCPFTMQDGRDGYDFTEWVAEQEWCNGKVAYTGNSGVAMVIWRIAAEQPPHLACIAPWEGTGDMYRESVCVGGIPSALFNEGIVEGISCNNYAEDMGNMSILHPFHDAYWESVTPRWENIRVPAYVTAGYCHFHLHGSIEGFRRIRSTKKWLRIHREMEWPDTYHKDNVADLKLFFDRYLKDIHNGWEFTPKIRTDIMDAYDFDLERNHEEREYPIARTEYKKIYLDAATGTGSYTPFEKEAEIAYDPEKDVVSFDYQFEEDTLLIGYMKLHLGLEVRGYDNTDIFVWVKKYSADGEYRPVFCTGENYRGAWGYFRGSHRELDEKLSTDFQPVQAHKKEEPFEEGQVYPVDIEIWPHSRFWHKGERIRVEISGHFIKSEWYEDMRMHYDTDNGNGTAVIHTGGKHDAYLQIPVIPPKYQVGDLLYDKMKDIIQRENIMNYKANGGLTYMPAGKNINIPLKQCVPLSQPSPLINEPVLNKEFLDKGYIPAECSQHFLPGVTAEMLDWFWANMEKCYYLWAPGCHKSFEWVKSPIEYGMVESVHKVCESMGPGVPPMGGDGIVLHRMDLKYFPFKEHLEHVIIEAILNDKGEIFNLGVHMWEDVEGGCIHITRGATNTRISEPPRFVIDFSKAEKQMDELEEADEVMPHPEYEAAQWPVFLPKLYEIWKDHPDPSQSVKCNLAVKDNADGSISYIAENGPIIL